MNEVEEMLREMSEKYKNSKSVEVYEEQLEWWFKLIDDLREENEKLKSAWKMYRDECNQLREENKKLKEIIRKAKEFEYNEDWMHYIFENTKDIK